MNDQADDSIDDHPQTSDHLLATGGGNSPASGVTFQGSLGASFAIAAALDRPVDSRLELGSVRVRSLRFETEAPVDDILVPTSADGLHLQHWRNLGYRCVAVADLSVFRVGRTNLLGDAATMC
jgi:hypothetical protein